MGEKRPNLTNLNLHTIELKMSIKSFEKERERETRKEEIDASRCEDKKFIFINKINNGIPIQNIVIESGTSGATYYKLTSL